MLSCLVVMLRSGHVKGLRSWHQHHLLQHCGLSHLLRLLRSDRSVRPGQRCHRRSDEASGGEQQGSQGGGGAGGGVGAGEQAPSGRNGNEVTPAQPDDTGHGQVKFWGFPLEVYRRRGQGAGNGWSCGLTHCWYNQRHCKHQSRACFMPGHPAGGDKSFFVLLVHHVYIIKNLFFWLRSEGIFSMVPSLAVLAILWFCVCIKGDSGIFQPESCVRICKVSSSSGLSKSVI